MKKIKNLLITTIISIVSSCSLEVNPTNSVTFENFFKTERDLQSFTTSMRFGFKGLSTLHIGSIPAKYAYIVDFSTMGDALYQSRNWEVMDFIDGKDFSKYYELAAMANIMMENGVRAEIPKNRIDYYQGIAYFYRGYSYFKLGQIWGDAMIVKDSKASGAHERRPKKEVLQFALDNINAAIELLPGKGEVRDGDGKVVTDLYLETKDAAYAMKADLCLWFAAMDNNNKDILKECIEAADYLINSPTSKFSLVSSPEDVVTSVLVGGSSEGIYELPFDPANDSEQTTLTDPYVTFPVNPEHKTRSGIHSHASAAANRIYYITVDEMYPGVYTNPATLGYTPENFTGDKRRLSYFYKLDSTRNYEPYWTQADEKYAYPYKLRKIRENSGMWDAGTFRDFAVNNIIYRLSDIYLIRAEAHERNNDDGKAIKDLNTIRFRAYGDESGNYDSSEGDLRFAIFKECEKEFILEGKRFIDIHRNNYWKTELSNYHATFMTQADVDRGALYMPIQPQAFINNSKMTQNPYWLSRF